MSGKNFECEPVCLVSVSDLVSLRPFSWSQSRIRSRLVFFSESRIQYWIRLDMGMIPDSDSSTQKLVSPTSDSH